MEAKIKEFQKRVIEREEKVLTDLDVKTRLTAICSSSDGLRKFAEAFYFTRHKFCQLNFIIGARCSTDETLWRGLVLNLYEELGGGDGEESQ